MCRVRLPFIDIEAGIGPIEDIFELWPYRHVRVRRTDEETIVEIPIRREIKKEEVKVRFIEGLIEIRLPRRKLRFEEIPIE
ncbi:MAG: hypothetical protein ACUVTD_00365 [Nitrososphaerales archaeon]